MAISKRELLTTLCKDSRRVLIVSGGTLLITLVAAIFAVPTYKAESRLLVLPSSEYGYHGDAGSDAASATSLETDTILNSEISILTSRPLERDVVSKIGAAKLYPSLMTSTITSIFGLPGSEDGQQPDDAHMDHALDAFAHALTASPAKSASIIEVSFSHRDPQLAAAAVNSIVETYLARRTQLFADTQSSLLADQAENLSQQLESAAQAYATYAADNSISNFQTQLNLLLEQKADLEKKARAGDTTITEYRTRLKSVDQQLMTTPANVIQYSDSNKDQSLEALRTQLAAAQARVASLAQTRYETSPDLVMAQGAVVSLQSTIQSASTNQAPSEVRTSRNPLYEALLLDRARAESTVKAAESEQHQIADSIAALDVSIRALNSKDLRLDELGRQKALTEQNYASVVKALDQRRVIENVEAHRAANVRVVQPAEPPLYPTPLRLMIIVGGIILSVVTGGVTALTSSLLRSSFLSPEEVERRLSVPVLASVAEFGVGRPKAIF